MQHRQSSSRLYDTSGLSLLALVAVMLGLMLSPTQARTFESYGAVVLQGLDKITARIKTFEIPVGETGSFGGLNILVHTCQKTVPEDLPETAAFLEITDVSEARSQERVEVFSGWMYASSPALSALEHPIYDITVVDCKNPSISAEENPPS